MVIVAGGGIIGLSCAWRLAQRGVPVTLIDAGSLAAEASWAAAGMLAPGGEFETASPAAAMAILSLSLYPDFVRELEEESGLRIDFRVCGAIETAFCEQEALDMERRAGLQQALGIRSESALHEGRPARFYPGDALVNPRDVTAALIQACRRRNVELREREPVLGIEEDGAGVRTAAGVYPCDGVIVAAGAWSSALHPALPRSFPVRGHLIGWQSGSSDGAPILRNANTYIVQRSGGAVVAGSSTELAGFDRTVDASVVAAIRARVARLMPSAPLDRSDAWLGFRPGIEGEEPAVGKVPGTRIYTAYGHYRNGILLAPETAQRIDRLTASS